MTLTDALIQRDFWGMMLTAYSVFIVLQRSSTLVLAKVRR